MAQLEDEVYKAIEDVKPEVEKLNAEAGSQLALENVLAVSNGSDLEVGNPYIEGAAVRAVVMEHLRGHKLISYKYKKRKGYSRKVGHRQELTRLKIQALQAGDLGSAGPQPAAEASEPTENEQAEAE